MQVSNHLPPHQDGIELLSVAYHKLLITRRCEQRVSFDYEVALRIQRFAAICALETVLVEGYLVWCYYHQLLQRSHRLHAHHADSFRDDTALLTSHQFSFLTEAVLEFLVALLTLETFGMELPVEGLFELVLYVLGTAPALGESLLVAWVTEDLSLDLHISSRSDFRLAVSACWYSTRHY